MAENDSPTDPNSSPESSRDLLDLSPASLRDFYIKRRFVYGRDANGKHVKITRLSDLGIDPAIIERLQSLQRFKTIATAREWTQFFLNNDVKLQGDLGCANKLKTASSTRPVKVIANCLFLYYSDETITVRGKEQGVMAGNVRRVHLEDSKERVTIEAGSLYAIGDLNIPNPPPFRPCLLCPSIPHRHNVINGFTPCEKIYRFVSTNSSILKMTKYACYHGAAILRVPESGKPELRTCSFRQFLCEDCKTRAITEGNQWFQMTGDCPQEEDICPNHLSCDCVEDKEENEEHIDYFFVPEASVNNLPKNPIAEALSSNLLELVWAVGALSFEGRNRTVYMKQEAMKRMKAGETTTISQLMEAGCVSTLDEFLGLVMSDIRLADLVAGSKTFSLSKVNGFVEKPEVHKVGLWLEGRLVASSDSLSWHIPHMRKVVVETREDVSSIRRAHPGDEKSDTLGGFIK